MIGSYTEVLSDNTTWPSGVTFSGVTKSTTRKPNSQYVEVLSDNTTSTWTSAAAFPSPATSKMNIKYTEAVSDDMILSSDAIIPGVTRSYCLLNVVASCVVIVGANLMRR